jgi:hypothetical protein
MSEKTVSTGLISVEISKALPLYRSETQSDRDLEYLAWQVRRAKIFKKYLPAPEFPDDQAEISLFEVAEEKHQAAMFRAIASEPELKTSVVCLLDWIKSNHRDDRAKLQQLVEALKVYEPHNALSRLSDSKMAKLHIILACLDFEGETRDGEYRGDVTPSATEIRKRALALFEETKTLAGLNRDISRVHWDRLFAELGIELKFPRGGWR